MAGLFEEAANLQGAFAPRVVNSTKTGQNNAIFKATRMCKFFVAGKCTRGPSCNFAHGEESLKDQPDLYKTQLCKSFDKSGQCMMGDVCMYAHGKEELRRSWAKPKPQHPGSVHDRRKGKTSSCKNIPEEATNAMPGCILLPNMGGLLSYSVMYPSDEQYAKEPLAWDPCAFNSNYKHANSPYYPSSPSPSSACKEDYSYGPAFTHVSTDCTTTFMSWESDDDDSSPAFSRATSMNLPSQQPQACDGQFLLAPCLALDEDDSDVMLVVKNTFLHFDQESPKAARKRSQSTPPGRF